MPTYLYRCADDDCPFRVLSISAPEPTNKDCPECGAQLRRDYRAEGANVNLSNCRAAR